MKRQVLNLTLLTALLTPIAVGMEIISDEELDDVSGGQVQQIINGGNINAHQDNDNGSVVLHGNVQRYAPNVINVAASVDNVATNIANVSGTNVNVIQTNNQCGNNTVHREHQEIFNGGDLNDTQDNQNASVLITENVQRNGNAIYTVNAAVSGVGVATNIATVTAPGGIADVDQTNEQHTENNVALNDIDTLNPSMGCGGKDREGCQYVENAGDNSGGYQRNSQGSVYISDDAQSERDSLNLINIAISSVNSGINIADVRDPTDTAIIDQSNVQDAANNVAAGSINEDYEFRQEINNLGPTGPQDNNNLSVFITGNAQNSASGIILVNGAASAINAGVNIANATTTNDITVNQSNEQAACNWVQTDHPQYVNNSGPLLGPQRNNNGSVIPSGSPTFLAIVNTTLSAVNEAVNIASATCTGAGCSITINQTNTQNATNVLGASTTNPGCVACP